MKIALVEDGVYPFDLGGHEIRVHHLVKYLSKEHDVNLYVQEKKDVNYPDTYLGASIIEVPCFIKNEHLRLPLGSLIYARNVAPLLDGNEYDVIDIPFFSLDFDTDAKVVATYGAFLARWDEALGPREKLLHFLPFKIQKYLSRKKLRMADEVLCLSDLSYEEARSLGADAECASIVTNGYNQDLFHPDIDTDFRERQGIGEEENVVLSAGRLHREKGFLDLVEAFKKSEETDRLVLAGDGPLREEIEDRAGNHSNDVILVGSKEYEEMPELYAAADVLVLASHFELVTPMICIEAMACGTPVISSDISGPRLEHEENALIYPKRDSDALSERLDRMFEEEGTRKKLVESGFDFVRDRTWKRTAEKTLEAYR